MDNNMNTNETLLDEPGRQSFGRYLGCHMRSLSAGFWIYVLAAVLMIVSGIVYIVSFHGVELGRYYALSVFLLPVIVSCASLTVAFFVHFLAKWMPLVFFMGSVYAFCELMNTSYLYLSSNFYGGVSMEAIMGMSGAYLFVVIIDAVIMILGAVAVFMGTERKPEKTSEGDRRQA